MTTRSANSKAVTIFEGPDGGGKTTLAQEYAQLTNARYVHHGPYKQVDDGLGRLFVESMLPALLGYEDVVLDRCWLSEPIYADAYRSGRDRITAPRARVLDRLALRCGAVVVKCLPPWDRVRDCFRGRKGEEYLDNEEQLIYVYGRYDDPFNPHLHQVEYDYTEHLNSPLSLTATRLHELVKYQRDKSPTHRLAVASSGNWKAPVVLVGEGFAEQKNNDPLYQAPFGSLNGAGCSLWLSNQLDAAGINEQGLLWVNADEVDRVPDFLGWHADKLFVTLGEQASSVLDKYGMSHKPMPHPQYWKRFKGNFDYPLLSLLKEVTREHAA